MSAPPTNADIIVVVAAALVASYARGAKAFSLAVELVHHPDAMRLVHAVLVLGAV
jgi:hypothetical protein